MSCCWIRDGRSSPAESKCDMETYMQAPTSNDIQRSCPAGKPAIEIDLSIAIGNSCRSPELCVANWCVLPQHRHAPDSSGTSADSRSACSLGRSDHTSLPSDSAAKNKLWSLIREIWKKWGDLGQPLLPAVGSWHHGIWMSTTRGGRCHRGNSKLFFFFSEGNNTQNEQRQSRSAVKWHLVLCSVSSLCGIVSLDSATSHWLLGRARSLQSAKGNIAVTKDTSRPW